MDGQWVVRTAEGGEVLRFDTEEDARDMAEAWNRAYPAPEYVEFIVTHAALAAVGVPADQEAKEN